MVEVELISLVKRITEKLGLKDISVHINSIGCGNCRKEYNKALLSYLNEHKDHLCPTCRDRMERNPLRVLDCKVEGCKEIVKDAPRTIDYLDDECRAHFEELQNMLSALNIPFEVDTGIVRGLDYYTRTVFEFVNKDGFTLCGGGRYDGLVKEIDEKHDIPSAGFGMGLERVLYFLNLEGIDIGGVTPPQLYIAMMPDVKVEGYKLINSLRQQGISVETDYMGKSVKAQMKYANKIHAPYVVVLGADEIASGKVRIKNMEDGSETECAIEQIIDIVK